MIKEEILKYFADYIFLNSGMVYPANDYYRLEGRLNELVRIFSVENVEEVYSMYKKNITPDMKAVLINLSTNNETYFFRDVKPFNVFSKVILPELFLRSPVGSLNIWSAASSTGQEVYSLLMSSKDSLKETEYQRLNVTASDISSDALNKARKGIYNGLDIQRGLPVTSLVEHFTQTDDGYWKINNYISNKVKFYEFNLLKDKYPRNMYQVIFCRNVLIYQEIKNKSNILSNIYDSLADGGFLFLGNGESLIGIETKLERVTVDNYTFYKKRN